MLAVSPSHRPIIALTFLLFSQVSISILLGYTFGQTSVFWPLRVPELAVSSAETEAILMLPCSIFFGAPEQ